MKKYRIGHKLKKINIAPEWRVLDIGSGHKPLIRADILIDYAIQEIKDRLIVPERASLIIADGQKIPLKDKSVDYVITSHMAEHVADPAGLCNELMRVAEQGYIETPGIISELLLNEPYHFWNVYTYRGTIIFKKKQSFTPIFPKIYSIFYYGTKREGHKLLKFSNPLLHYPFCLLRWLFIFIWFGTPFTITVYKWKGKINYKIIE
jgi:hypothetical protein